MSEETSRIKTFEIKMGAESLLDLGRGCGEREGNRATSGVC